MGVSSNSDLGTGKVPQRMIRELVNMPYMVSYTDLAVDFGAGDSTAVIATSVNFRGKVMAVDAWNNAETFNSVTTAASVEIGDGSDADGFAFTDDFADGTVGQHFSAADGSITDGALGGIIEPDDQVTMTRVAPTGGTPTGIADVTVTLLYFQ